MADTFNPFEHHHEHGHDEPEGAQPPLDPAQESLADALRVSFFLLKIAMVILVIWYAFSNFFTVSEQQRIVVLRFGQIVGEDGQQVYKPGGLRPAWPNPIDELIPIQHSVRELRLDQSFTYKKTRQQELQASQGPNSIPIGPMKPEEHGYLLTADGNIVHTQWLITYEITDEIAYLRNVGDEAQAEQFVRVVAERSIIEFAAGTTADEIIDGINGAEQGKIQALMQAALGPEGLDTGLTIKSVTSDLHQPPVFLLTAFAMTTQAQAMASRQIQQANTNRAKRLNEAAGPAAEPLWQLVEQYEQVRWADEPKDDAARADLKQRRAELEAKISEAFNALNVNGLTIGGEAARIINDAKTEATQFRSRLEESANTYEKWVAWYGQDSSPGKVFTRARIWWDVMADMLANPRLEKYLLPRNVIPYIEMNPDPQWKLDDERFQREAEQKARLEGTHP